jgi:hypothetical protein
VVEQPTTVAPGHGPDPMQQSHGLPPDVDLQEERDIDSMDFLNFLIALGEYTGGARARVGLRAGSDIGRLHCVSGRALDVTNE